MGLIINRKREEKFWVGNALVTVNRIGHNRVELEIEAPGDVPVLRDELTRRKKAADPEVDPQNQK